MLLKIKKGGAFHHLYKNDCLVVLPKLRSYSIKCSILSPPYNIGKKYASYEDQRDDYLHWVGRWTQEIKRVLDDNGHFFLNMGSKPSQPNTPYEVFQEVCKYFVCQNSIMWIKSYSEEDSNKEIVDQFGHYKPINSQRYLNDTWEFIWHFTKDGNVPIDRLAIGVPYKDKTNLNRGRGNGKDKRCRGNVWFFSYDTVHGAKKHPAAFPERLPELCLQLAGIKPGDTVLDIFSGSGTTNAVAAKNSINSVGIELDQGYYDDGACRVTEVLGSGASVEILETY